MNLKKILKCCLVAVMMLFTFIISGCNENTEVSNIEIITDIDTNYFDSDTTFSVNGGKIKVSYDDGSSEIIDIEAYMLSEFDSSVGTHEAIITYGGKTTTFTYKVDETLEPIKVIIRYGIKAIYLEENSESNIGFDASFSFNIDEIYLNSGAVTSGTSEHYREYVIFENEGFVDLQCSTIFTMEGSSDELNYRYNLGTREIVYESGHRIGTSQVLMYEETEISRNDIGTTKNVLLKEFNHVFGIYLTLTIEQIDN